MTDLIRSHAATRTITTLLIIASSFLLHALVIAQQLPCVGDIDGNGSVTIDELIIGVNVALGIQSIEAALAFDRDESGDVDVAELVTAVGNALAGCPSTQTPTEVPTRAATATPTSQPTLGDRFERSKAFDAAVAGIAVPDGDNTTVSAMSVDLDGDGRLDVLVSVEGGPISTWVLFQRGVDVWEQAVLVEGLGGPRALTDLNGDGYLDLVVAGPLGVAWGGSGGIDLLDVQPLAGVPAEPAPIAITAMDFDGDGRTDLAAATWAGRSRILYQEPDGSFVEQQLGPGLTFALCPVDFDGDGLMDLLSMVDGLFEAGANEGGAWQQRAPRVWVHGPPQGWPADRYIAPGPSLGKGTPMGCAWGDLNGDREPELWLSQFSLSTPIYHRDGTSWRDVGGDLNGIAGYPQNEIQGLEVFWGVAIVDFDGDGRDDIAVAGGNDEGHAGILGKEGVSHTSLFIQEATGFRERGRELGLEETGDFRSLLADDLDGDGRPDLLVGAFRGLPRLYLNRLDRRGGTLVVEPRGPAVENVEIEFVGSEASWTMRPGLQAQPLTGARPVLFRGVGAESELRLRVHWPAGVQELQVAPRAAPWVVKAP